MPGTCPGGGPGPPRGTSWSARSCCSRPPWTGSGPPTRPGWPAGRRPRRWPSATAADALRQWDRLGYPRRALWLHGIARALVSEHGGEVPASAEVLATLPGIGPYTAAAVATFAFGQRHAVLDTNVRRVLARLVTGTARPPAAPSAAERRLAEALLPADEATAARWSVAVMELGALVCTAARPACAACPVASACAWRAAGQPPSAARQGGPGLRRHRPAVPGRACWPCCARRTARCCPRPWTSPGMTQGSERVRSLPWSLMASSPGERTGRSPCRVSEPRATRPPLTIRWRPGQTPARKSGRPSRPWP